jgi:hypothetical protein
MKHRVIRARLLAHVAVLAATLAGCNALVGNDDIQISDGGAVVEGASAGDASSSDVTQHDARAMDAPSEALPSTDSPVTGDSPGDAPADTLGGEGGNDSGDAAPIPEAAVDTGPMCTASSQICGGVCTDVTSDSNHCGNCMTACAAPMTCQGGVCACSSRLTDCSGTCVDEKTDNSHCGDCVTRCPAGANGTICIGGVCACSAGLTNCNGTCVNAQTDNAHCGNCTTMCAGGMTGTTCVGGACSCPAGSTNCSGTCSTLSNDNNHCGSCSTTCAGGESCVGTTCTCPGGQLFCNGVCVNVATDSTNCGTCAKQCTSGVNCTSGRCVVRDGNVAQFSSSTNVIANYIFAVPVAVPYAITVTALGSIGTATGGGTFVMGLYTDSGGRPSSLLATASPASMVVGTQEVPVTATAIAAGTYWVAASVASPGTNKWGFQSTGTDYAAAYTYTGGLPAAAPAGMLYTTDDINFYLVGYE